MNMTIKLDKEYDPKEVLVTLKAVFSEKADFAQYKVAYYKGICENLEKKHKLTSVDFLKKFEAGDLGDDSEYFDWFAAKQGLDIWLNKLNILTGVSISEN